MPIEKLLIKKTLKENLPQRIATSNPELHFTEDGGLYMSKEDGTLQQIGVDDSTHERLDDIEGAFSDYYTKEEIDSALENIEVPNCMVVATRAWQEGYENECRKHQINCT